MSNIKVNVNSQNLTSIRVGQQNATKVVSSVGGLQGIQGLQGRQGLQGIAGEFAGQGAQGPLGGLGDQGTQGLQGLQGNIGYQGTQGLQGTQGRQGLQGNIGVQGFVGQPGGNAGRLFYFNRTDLSDIPGFYRATEAPSPHDVSSTVVGLSTTDDIVFDQFVTDLNSPGVAELPIGEADITLHVQLSEGSATVTLNVSLCEADGSGIFPISSSTSDIFTNTTIQQLNWSYVRTLPYSLGITRRLIYNFHINKITGSDSATFTSYYEDNVASHIKSSISAGAVGPQGIQGIRGNQGLQGNRGQQGAQGLLGRQGTQGISGEFAGQGTQGLQGDQGIQGIQGLTGPIAGGANQIVYKNASNVATGNTNLLFLNDSTFIVGTATSTGTASQPLQVTGGAYVSGNLGIGTTNAITQLHLSGFSTTNSNLKIGSLEFQNYSLNNSFFGDNVYWNGSEMVRRSTGAAGLFYFLSDEGQFRLSPVGLANSATVNNPQFKINSNGGFGIGSSLSQGLNDFTGSNFYVNPQGIVLVGTISSTGTASQRLQVTGDAYVSGNLGIGRTNPINNLQVLGGITAGNATSSTLQSGFSILRPNDSTPRTFAIVEDNTNLRIGGGAWNAVNIRTAPNNDVRVAITSSGNVGIGTTNLQAKFHSYGVDDTLSTVLGAPTNTLIEVNDDTPWSIAFRRTDLGPTADVAAYIDNNRNFWIGNGLPNGGFRYSVGLHTEYVKLYAYDQERFSTLGVGATVIGTLFANQLNISGISTLQSTTFIGTATSTGTASQPLQVTGGAYVSGNLGIGRTNPSNKLEVLGTIQTISSDITSVGSFAISPAGVCDVTAFKSTGGTLRFVVADTGGVNQERGRIISSGNVGIATTNPLQRLHVLGNLLVAAGSSTDQHITQKAYELNSGTLSWEGSAGQLFSITNNLTSGSIFSVNDVSGIPSIDVNADGTVSMVSYGGNLGIGTTLSTSKLHVVGTTLITGITTVGLGSTSTPPNNSQLSFELTSDTNLRIKVRGSDGILRSANITLA